MCHPPDGPGQSQRTTPSSHRLRPRPATLSFLPSAAAAFPIPTNTNKCLLVNTSTTVATPPQLKQTSQSRSPSIQQKRLESSLLVPLHLPSHIRLQVNHFSTPDLSSIPTFSIHSYSTQCSKLGKTNTPKTESVSQSSSSQNSVPQPQKKSTASALTRTITQNFALCNPPRLQLKPRPYFSP